MTNSRPPERGEFVRATADGRTVDAMVVLASPNGESLMIMFDALLDGCAGLMPLLLDEGGAYHNVMTGRPVEIERRDVEPWRR